MMLTQRISVLAHDLAKQCKVGGPKRSHSSSEVPSSQKSEDNCYMYMYHVYDDVSTNVLFFCFLLLFFL